jgi:hypothetical protein
MAGNFTPRCPQQAAEDRRSEETGMTFNRQLATASAALLTLLSPLAARAADKVVTQVGGFRLGVRDAEHLS